MKILEFDKDFVEYENKLRAQKKLAVESKTFGYKAKEAANGLAIAVGMAAVVFSLIVLGWVFA